MENGSPPAPGGIHHVVGLIAGFGLFIVVLLVPLPGFLLETAQRLIAEKGASIRPVSTSPNALVCGTGVRPDRIVPPRQVSHVAIEQCEFSQFII